VHELFRLYYAQEDNQGSLSLLDSLPFHHLYLSITTKCRSFVILRWDLKFGGSYGCAFKILYCRLIARKGRSIH